MLKYFPNQGVTMFPPIPPTLLHGGTAQSDAMFPSSFQAKETSSNEIQKQTDDEDSEKIEETASKTTSVTVPSLKLQGLPSLIEVPIRRSRNHYTREEIANPNQPIPTPMSPLPSSSSKTIQASVINNT